MASRQQLSDNDHKNASTKKVTASEAVDLPASRLSTSSRPGPNGADKARHSNQPSKYSRRFAALFRTLLRGGGIEENGIRPVAVEERNERRFFRIFTIWFSISCNVLAIPFGMLGPLAYNLGLRDSALVILFFNLVACGAPGLLATFGPKTGMRQMVHARYSFGRHLVTVPVLLNLATLTGFNVIICVVGGQCLSAISSGSITPSIGIVTIAIVSLVVSFAGFKVLHVFETFSFIPALISIIITVGIGGTELTKQSAPADGATAADMMTFGMIVAAYQIPWAAIASDLTTYFDPKVPSWRVFHYTYWGLLTPTVLLMTLGAAIAGALPNNPAWRQGNEAYGIGGVLAAMLSSAGGFGKFVVVLQSLSLLGNTCSSVYAITLNFQALAPLFLRVPRYLFAVVITAVIIPVAIYAYRDFYTSLSNFMSLISYWSASFVGVVMADHVVVRRCRFDSYDPSSWSRGDELPLGMAALASAVLSFGLVVPCVREEWYTGPIASETGDIGFEVAFALSALAYVPLRLVEKKLSGR
ncbi:hypothetical protein E4U42_005255 [Claviceps africana]|uniref:Purine-cytosine permease n=1 Tax=Claviceps africana TaxID=83212 RepID=A0A8K0NK60_9HYPO|nr:hypothetical protein E4U42_005255 [Claviceps africana]